MSDIKLYFLKTVATVMAGIFMFCPKISQSSINSIRIGQGIDNVRVVFDAGSSFDYKVFTLKDPKRLVVDIYNTQVAKSFSDNIAKNSIISGVRQGDIATGKRFVFDLKNPCSINKISFLKPQSGFNWRFFIDLSIISSREFDKKIGDKYAFTNFQNSKENKNIFKRDNPITNNAKINRKIIVLDPGHGGKDPGAIGYSGTYEKNITLAMSKELKAALEKEGYIVYLTRNIDTFINLRERYKIARKKGAVLFISIHADSAKNRKATGLSVYTLSETASDKEAAALAERENKADLIDVDLSGFGKDVSSILISLSQNMATNNSSEFAEILQKEMAKEVKLVNNAHRFAGFAVLKSPNIPSVLLELGYLSNRNEEQSLKTASYRKKLANATVRAVNKYFAEPRE